MHAKHCTYMHMYKGYPTGVCSMHVFSMQSLCVCVCVCLCVLTWYDIDVAVFVLVDVDLCSIRGECDVRFHLLMSQEN